jgi:hypothetical protein
MADILANMDWASFGWGVASTVILGGGASFIIYLLGEM